MSVAAGRPKGDSDARARLIAAALHCFSHQSFAKVSTRQLAREAGVDAALIRYYFGSKLGLFEQMFRETLAPVLARFRQQPKPQFPLDLASLMQTYYSIMVPNPGLPRLVLRVLQEEEGTALHQVVMGLFGEIMQLSRQWLTQALMASGRLRPDVEPQLAQFSFASLMVFPLIAPTPLVRLFGVDLNPQGLTDLIAHNVQVMEKGLLLPQERAG
ncbi:TetR/AcrR family transcriptional regulator [Gallaecimonas xiamenensis]|uniref:TetR family transcriptional regulator n=1 Tax=Gallaecimonas xiamenensis 3-C-1 TaxID=745411 RepID=K2IPY7_9GAMM|nr:TetR/AcrR family transcriptional regulator [Gallaecimonas xiamenensis]EKE72166.1 TetR family transcriptional regulator [Gallaecimonas xiamenensis 3-C-1]